MFIMTLGGFGDIWNEIPNTKHEVIGNILLTCITYIQKFHVYNKIKICILVFIPGKIHWFLFIALLVILLLNLLIAMMGDTYAKVWIAINAQVSKKIDTSSS